MGIDPEVFYRMEWEDFWLKREGWYSNRVMDHMLIRKQTFIISMTLGQKLSALEKSWPDPTSTAKRVKMVKYKGVEMTERQAQKLAKLKKESKKNG